MLIARKIARRISRRRRPSPRRGRLDCVARYGPTSPGRDHRPALPPAQTAQGALVLRATSPAPWILQPLPVAVPHALQRVFERVETFTFSVRSRVSPTICAAARIARCSSGWKRRDWSAARASASRSRSSPRLALPRRSPHHRRHSLRRLGHRRSDQLATELLRIKRRAARVIWLNPPPRNPSYEPLTRGMAAALRSRPLRRRHNLAAPRPRGQVARSGRCSWIIDPPRTRFREWRAYDCGRGELFVTLMNCGGRRRRSRRTLVNTSAPRPAKRARNGVGGGRHSGLGDHRGCVDAQVIGRRRRAVEHAPALLG